MKNIVVGTDFSEPSEIAVEQAMHIARHVGAEITLVHAGKPSADAEVTESIAADQSFTALVQQTEDDERVELSELRERLSNQGVTVHQRFVGGFPDTAICEVSTEIDADIMVTGTHGRSGLKRILLGSVAERVVRLACKPVLVSKNRAGAGGFKKILVPIDFSELSLNAVKMAMALAANEAEIELLHCWQLPPQGASTRATQAVLKPILTAIQADVESRGNKLLGEYAETERTVSFHSVRNVPAQGIQDRLAENDYELVVMGSHGRRGIRRFILGSVAEATVRHAECSVLVVHGGEEAAA